ncbi:MAG: condensation domain-containing protein, partial [Trichodesmium sp. St7_bin2_1]|nr:condensation domain-containing protein [Trichodesmium sp. St7_bin2_1]
EVVREIQIAVSTEHELEVYGVILLKTGSIPKTSSGKIQRRACKLGFRENSLNVVGKWQKTIVEITEEQEYVAPRTSSEQIIANNFAEVLGREKVGLYDNFFELGGHSLLATQLISRLRESFKVEIPLRALFESATIAQLDSTLKKLGTNDSGLSIPPIQPRTEREKLPLSWGQERLWFLDQYEAGSHNYDESLLLNFNGLLDFHALDRALRTLLERHEALRTNFVVDDQSDKPIPYQKIGKAESFVLHQTTIAKDDLPNQVASALSKPFDLRQDLLFRVHLFHVSDQQHYLLLNTHHILVDAWSLGIIVRELLTLYQAYSGEEENPLAPLAIQYADYAAWQREYLSGERLAVKLDYWQKQLAGVETLDLPTTYPRPAEQSYRGKNLDFSLNRSVSEGLQQLSQRHQVTLFMTLLGAFGLLMSRYSGQEDIAIGTPIANRERAELEGIVGFFVNTLVLRLELCDNQPFSQWLQQVKATTLEAYAHQDAPFEQVVDALSVERERA